MYEKKRQLSTLPFLGDGCVGFILNPREIAALIRQAGNPGGRREVKSMEPCKQRKEAVK